MRWRARPPTSPESWAACRNVRIPEIDNLARVRVLGEEIMALKAEHVTLKTLPRGEVVEAYRTYDHAFVVQHRTIERRGLVKDLRSRIRLVVDNSELWDA